MLRDVFAPVWYQSLPSWADAADAAMAAPATTIPTNSRTAPPSFDGAPCFGVDRAPKRPPSQSRRGGARGSPTTDEGLDGEVEGRLGLRRPLELLATDQRQRGDDAERGHDHARD